MTDLDMLTDQAIVELLCERGWQANIVPDQTGKLTRYVLWSSWQEGES